ncbi:hypothetical protein [Pseudomonas putida]|uniref:hypothetical protein n=1 Tax=Pseudomonas putida TaxID=303 RepID=UPI0021F89C90|nr:hypothetical protein [Pseudomonas putida]
MDDKAAATADALELLINQTALIAAIEELSTWVRQRDSVNVHDSAMTCLQALDTNASRIAYGIERLRASCDGEN